MYTINPLTVAAVLLLYAGIFTIVRVIKPSIAPDERSTALLIGSVWAVSVFIANYVLFRAGVMSFLPWVNNFMHTFLWIGGCLTFLYLGVWRTQPMWVQFVCFATFSVIVKVFEHVLFGTWEHPNFFGVFQGNAAYIIGWSLADGLYPPLTYFGLKLLHRPVPALKLA
jgi:hypothetical protein